MNKSKDPSLHYYFLATLSAFLVGVNSFVVALNFMLAHHVPSVVTFACAFSGFILNTTLYWRGGAHKLRAFYQALPLSLYSYDTIVALSSGLCIGALTYASYLEQYASLSPWWQLVLPYQVISIASSAAFALSTFVLFYDEDTGQKPSTTPIKSLLAYASSLVQSGAYTALNYTCVYQLFDILFPTHNIVNQCISSFLSLGLFAGEIKFNYGVLSSFSSHSSTTIILHTPTVTKYAGFCLLWSSILLNGFANGWIALGYFTSMSPLQQLLIVANGTFVSVAVMKDSIDHIFAQQETSQKTNMLPSSPQDTSELVSWFKYFTLHVCLAYGLSNSASTISPIIPSVSSLIICFYIFFYKLIKNALPSWLYQHNKTLKYYFAECIIRACGCILRPCTTASPSWCWNPDSRSLSIKQMEHNVSTYKAMRQSKTKVNPISTNTSIIPTYNNRGKRR